MTTNRGPFVQIHLLRKANDHAPSCAIRCRAYGAIAMSAIVQGCSFVASCSMG